MLHRLSVRDFVIVRELDLAFADGFTVLTGETGAGKSILIDALQLVLGSRADAGVVREGAPRADLSAEFDRPPSLQAWLEDGGFDTTDAVLLMRRSIDAQGRSRAWINGHPATAAQLREVADHVLDIHGQHAWQSLTRPAAVRALLDARAGVDGAALGAAWRRWREAVAALARARADSDAIGRQREGLAWQVGELRRLAPGADEWDGLNAAHQRLTHAHALMEAAQAALQALRDGEATAEAALDRAAAALDAVVSYDGRLQPALQTLQEAQTLLADAAHTLHGYLGHADLDPEPLQALDERLSAWVGLARRFRRPPAELPALLAQWERELAALEQATDLDALEQAVDTARLAFDQIARRCSRAREQAAGALAAQVTQAMQQLGMAGGSFEVALVPEAEPQSHGLESVEFRVAGHAGGSPRALAKVASGGELSRLALAIAVSTARQDPLGVATLIFDEIDAGVGGSIADTVGRLMKQLGRQRQVLSVTHLAQVAACADHHLQVSKAAGDGQTTFSAVAAISGQERVREIARMLGGEHLSTSLAHAQAMLTGADGTDPRR